MADEMGVTFLGDIELDPRLGQSCDLGKSFINDLPDSRVTGAYKKIIASKLLIMPHFIIIKTIIINTAYRNSGYHFF